MTRKLILPSETQVCATCSYWDGERRVDAEVGVVVVDHCAEGECLVCEQEQPALLHSSHKKDCAWEQIEADDPDTPPTPDATDKERKDAA